MELGALELSHPPPEAILAPVAGVAVHPHFVGAGLSADLALVRLVQPVGLTPTILPICTPRPGQPFLPGTACWVTGWGSIVPEGECPHPRTSGFTRAGSLDIWDLSPAPPQACSCPGHCRRWSCP